MKVCFLADARSPIARNWIRYFIEQGHEIHVISSYPCAPDVLPGAKLYPVPVAFNNFAPSHHTGGLSAKIKQGRSQRLRSLIRRHALSKFMPLGRYWLAPLEIFRHVATVRTLIQRIDPDLIHAMRIPFEGMLAARATPLDIPLVISVWGNDFTLFAQHYPVMGWQTRQAMQRVDALHCDCHRDLRLASDWGFEPSKPGVVLPGSGGIPTAVFHPGPGNPQLRQQLGIPEGAPVVMNARGFRGYVRNDMFFESIPHVLHAYPDTIFICSDMHANPTVEQWLDDLDIRDNVRLLPRVSHTQMADFFRLATITVSPSMHDGTPNTLLEAMACGCFPVAGNIESVREWIQEGVNGLLCDPSSASSQAQATVQALSNHELRRQASAANEQLISERAEYSKVMADATRFYDHAAKRQNHVAHAS